MHKTPFASLDIADQDLIEALERASQGERKRLSRHANLDSLQIDAGLFPTRFAPSHAKEMLLFAAASRRARRALLRMRAGGRVTWWMLWHSGYAIERLIAVMDVPVFGQSVDVDYDGVSDHAGSVSVRAVAMQA